MYLNKKNLFLVISILLIFFFLTYNDVKSSELKIIDGDTIHLNGEKIRFSGIDTPEIKQTCIKNNEVIKCGIKAKELLIKAIGNKKINFVTTDNAGAYQDVVDIDSTGNVNIKNGANSITFKDNLSNIGSVTTGVMDIRSNFINLEASVGGSISIDIIEKGKDKGQVVKHIVDMGYNKIIYCG